MNIKNKKSYEPMAYTAMRRLVTLEILLNHIEYNMWGLHFC